MPTATARTTRLRLRPTRRNRTLRPMPISRQLLTKRTAMAATRTTPRTTSRLRRFPSARRMLRPQSQRHPVSRVTAAAVRATSLGLSFGGSKVDENCAALETARSFDSMNERLAGCKVKISTKYAKKAGVTLEDCMATEMVIAPPPVAVVPPPAPQQPIVVVVPAQAAPAPVAVPVVTPAPSPAIVWTSVCTFAGKVSCNVPGSDAVVVDPAHPTSVCKIMIDSAARAYKRSNGARFILVGNRNRDESDLLPTARANNVRKLLKGPRSPIVRDQRPSQYANHPHGGDRPDSGSVIRWQSLPDPRLPWRGFTLWYYQICNDTT